MKNSKIEWCDHTFNPWIGCTKVSPGCANCYAEARDQRFAAGAHWGKGAPRQRTSAANWLQPLKWNKTAICKCGGAELIGSDDCQHCGENFDPATRRRPRVFCASLADWLDNEVDVQWLSDLLCLAVFKCTHLDWQLLTKRPQNWRSRLQAVAQLDDIGGQIAQQWLAGKVPPNVWVGTTVENQECADKRIPELLSIPAKVRFLSCEPLLGPVDLSAWCVRGVNLSLGLEAYKIHDIHWVICGGESGPQARPMHPDWAQSLRDQCAAAGVPFLFKQWGEWVGGKFDARKGKAMLDDGVIFWTNPGYPQIHYWPAGDAMQCKLPISARVGKKAYRLTLAGEELASNNRLLDGVEHNQFPEA